MELIDIGILAAILIPALVGVIYGFLNIVLSIVAWVVSFAVAMRFGDSLAPMLNDYVGNELLRNILGFFGLFILCLILFSALGYFMLKLLGRTGLTGVDRILGLFFGLGLGSFIVALMVFLAGFTDMPGTFWWQDSLLVGPFERTGVWAERFLPDNIVEHHGYDTNESL